MPVISEHSNPSMGAGDQATAKFPSTSSTYLIISLAILLTVGITLSRRKCKKVSYSSNSNPQSSVFICKRKISTAAARMMQATTPTSALPEKPYLPNADAMEGQQATGHHEDEKSSSQESFDGSLFYSPQRPLPQNYQLHESSESQNVVVQTKAILPPPFHTRLGSLPAVTTSLLHPEPPSPTITMASSKIQSIITPLNQNPYSPPQNQFHYTQSPSQYHPQPSQFQPYTQNEILFVPSPTEYTSFEALYSKFPPSSSSSSTPIYHGENPTSYTEATFPSSSTSAYPSVSNTTATYPLTSTSISSSDEVNTVPRRRSYIKTLSNGSEMSGEVVEAVGQWRRHTRVFGGGVCIACEESESRRMSA